MSTEYDNLVLTALDGAIRSAVEESIERHIGCSIDTEIKQVIRDKARSIIETSPELQSMIFDALGRKLEPWEIVHHKNGNTADNSIENLEVQQFGAHTAMHSRGRRKDADARRSMEAFALMREELRRCREVRADLLEALQEISRQYENQNISHVDFRVAAKQTADAALTKATAAGN